MAHKNLEYNLQVWEKDVFKLYKTTHMIKSVILIMDIQFTKQIKEANSLQE